MSETGDISRLNGEPVEIEHMFTKMHAGYLVNYGRMADGRVAAYRDEEPLFLLIYPSIEEGVHGAAAAIDFFVRTKA